MLYNISCWGGVSICYSYIYLYLRWGYYPSYSLLSYLSPFSINILFILYFHIYIFFILILSYYLYIYLFNIYIFTNLLDILIFSYIFYYIFFILLYPKYNNIYYSLYLNIIYLIIDIITIR